MAKKRKKGSGAGNRRPGETVRSRRARPGKTVVIVAVVAVVAALVWAGIVYDRKAESERLEAGRVADESVGETRRDTVTIKTSKGDIVLKLYPDLMPVTVANFEKLARAGFYSNLVWHRVEDWVVQTGDPTGTGRGGSGESIRLETHPKLLNRRGGVGMARGEDPDSATSQFYILREDASWLDGKYALFGYVVDGMGAVDRLVAGDMLLEVSVEQEPAGGR